MSFEDIEKVHEHLKELSQYNEKNDILDRWKFALFPLARFVMEINDESGRKLINEVHETISHIIDYVNGRYPKEE